MGLRHLSTCTGTNSHTGSAPEDYKAHRRNHASAFRLNALMLTGSCTLAGLGGALALAPHTVQAAEPAGTAVHDYAIAAGRLSDVLAQFAAASGVALSLDPQAMQGEHSSGLQGRYTVEQGFAALLRGSQWQVQAQGSNGFTLQAAPALAPTPSNVDASDLPEVQVIANQLGEITEGTGSYTPGTIATATRLVLTARETPQSVSVVTRQEMDDFNLNSINRIIEHTPGVSTITYDSERTEYYARGFGISEFQYDGVPITRNSRYASGETLSDTVIYDRVEILKGATGLLTGAGNPGATINLIRKKPTRDFQGYVSAGAGSWDAYRTEADVSGALNSSGSLRGRAAAALEDQHSYLDHYQRQTRVLYGTLELDVTPSTLLTVGADYQYNAPKGSSWGGIRLYDSEGNFNAMPRSFNPGARWGHWDQYRKTAFATVEHQFSSGWTGKLQLNHQINGYDSELGAPNGYMSYPNPTDGSGVTMAGWLGKYQGEVKSNALDAYLSGPFEWFGREHELVVGASVFQQKLQGENYWPTADYDTSVPNYYDWSGDIAKPNWYLARLVGEKTRQNGLYASSRFNLADTLKLIVGSRISSYDYRYTYAAPATAATPTIKKDNGVIIPYAGIVYDLNEHWSLYASYTSIFQPQSNEDSTGKRLDPLTGKSYELGTKNAFFDGKLNASFAYFQTRQNNYAERTAERTPSGGIAYRAVDGVVVKGFEAELSGQLAPGWQVHAGYTHKVARLDGHKTSTIEPEDQFQLSTTYRLQGTLPGLSLGASARWQSKSWDDVNHPINGYTAHTAPAYWMADLSARYQINRHLSAAFHVNNVFDKKYYTLMSIYDVYSWGAPRSYNLSLRYDF